MFDENRPIQTLYDENGKFIGLYISPGMWDRIEKEVAPVIQRELDKIEQQKDPAIKEPMDDWENLKKFWDFRYPVDYDVRCEHCGLSTDNWQEDEPRKFQLKAASLSGLVAFQCRGCGARIIKKHFKDTIVVETSPPGAS